MFCILEVCLLSAHLSNTLSCVFFKFVAALENSSGRLCDVLHIVVSALVCW